MTDRDLPVTEDELHAFADGELPADRRDAVERWLASHPQDAARVAEWREQGEALHRLYDPVAGEPVPARLALDRLESRGRLWISAAAAAVFAALFVGGAIGWFARGASAAQPSAVEQLIGDALEAHRLYVVEVRHPVEVPGNEKAHLVQWLSKRLEAPLRAPDLDRIGLKLVGGRLLPGAAQPAAFFMYEAASGERFTLYTRRATAADSAMRYDALDRHGAVYWIDHGFGFVVSGRAERTRLQEIATLAYEQMEPRSPARRDGS